MVEGHQAAAQLRSQRLNLIEQRQGQSGILQVNAQIALQARRHRDMAGLRW